MEAAATSTNQEFSFADLLQAGFQPSDPILDPRWQNINIAPDNTDPFHWMGYRQPEDALSSASSSSDGSYAQSVYSASSEQLNPLNYTLPSSTYQQPYSNDQFPHNIQPSSLMDGDPQGAWAAQQLMHQHNTAHNYHSPATGGDPYRYPQQRDSGDYDPNDYSSGGEDQQPTHPALSPSPHHHPQHSQHPQPHQLYMYDQHASGASGASAGPGTASGASPYATSHTKAPDLYASPSPVGTVYTHPTAPDRQIRPGSSGGAYPASYASQAVQGGTRLTPVLEQLERLHYPTNPLSSSGAPQQQQLPSLNSNNSAGAGYGSPPGPNRNTRTMPASQSTSGGGSLPYGRPRAAHHSSHHRYAVGHQPNVSNGSSTLPSTSSQQSQPSPRQQQLAAAFPPSGMGKIFSPPPAILPIGNSIESAQHPPAKPKKEMVAGTPTHPDIPRPAIVAPPVPVPHLIKKSRGRQVPSVNSMGNAGTTTSVTSSHSSSRERRHDGRAGRERSYDGGLESPLSPHAPSGGYFPGTQWSDSEYEDSNPPVAHAHRSLFGQPSIPMDSYVGNTQNSGPGSTSTASSPATSSSRRTVDDAGPSTSGGPGTLATGSLEAELRSRPFVCTVEGCGKAYIRAEHLKRHVRSIHTNDKPFECPHPGCGREFSRYDNLCQHFKGVHGSTSTHRNQQHQ